MHNTVSYLSLAWNGNGGVGEVHASVSGTDFSKVYIINCRFSDAGIAASLLSQLKEKLGSGTISIPGVELPPGFELPGLAATASLSVSRKTTRCLIPLVRA